MVTPFRWSICSPVHSSPHPLLFYTQTFLPLLICINFLVLEGIAISESGFLVILPQSKVLLRGEPSSFLLDFTLSELIIILEQWFSHGGEFALQETFGKV